MIIFGTQGCCDKPCLTSARLTHSFHGGLAIGRPFWFSNAIRSMLLETDHENGDDTTNEVLILCIDAMRRFQG